MTAADVNLTEKVAREAARRFQADRSPSDTVDRDRSVFAEGASFALAALRSPEVVAGIAGVLAVHGVNILEGRTFNGPNTCLCGALMLPDVYTHQARAVVDWLTGGAR